MLRPVIDIMMTILLLLSMSYEKIGYSVGGNFALESDNFAPIMHEIIGMTLIILFFYHLWLNRYWLKNIFKGKYNAARFTLSLVNIILIIDVLFLLISGLIMSRILMTEVEEGMSFARTAHVLASYWGYVIMSFHIGLYWNVMNAMMFKKHKKKLPSFLRKFCLHFATLILICYGVFAFIKRQIAEYMFLISEFVFFDFEEPLIYFLLDYVAIMIMCAFLGHYLVLLFRKLKI